MSKKEMLINYTEGEECRIAIVENGRLEELYMERAGTGSHVGNIYKGRVTNVEPSIQAAFVDFGFDKNGFLHISDLQPSYFRGEHDKEDVGRKTARRDRPPIQECLRRGQEVIVQVTKEGIGTKGPTLTTYLSIPGRFLVLMPGMARMGVSRKIEDEEARRELRDLLEQLEPPENIGFIIRTAGLGRTKTDLQRDLNYLVRLWKAVDRKMKAQKAPAELYEESDLVIRTIRDIYTADIERIICDHETVARQAADFLEIAMPRMSVQVELYRDPVPLFHKYGIERELEKIHSRVVPLRIGGSLVIDQAEALVAIDVNSGKFRKPDNPEQTAFQINKEAAVEIARQLRLRDLGGVIVCDFIDMMDRRHQREIERAVRDAMKNDRARTKIGRLSQFGIIEMTRQRLRPSLKRSVYHDCPNCGGGGLVKTPESVCLDAMRLVQLAGGKEAVRTIEVHTTTPVAEYLNNKKRRTLAELEESSGKRILVKIDGAVGPEQLIIRCYDGRGMEVRFDASEFVAPSSASLTRLPIRRPDDRDTDSDADRDIPEPESADREPVETGAGESDRDRGPRGDDRPPREGDDRGGRRRGRRGRRGRGRGRGEGDTVADRPERREEPSDRDNRREAPAAAGPEAAADEGAEAPFGYVPEPAGARGDDPAPESASADDLRPPPAGVPAGAAGKDSAEPDPAAAEYVEESGPSRSAEGAGEGEGGPRRRRRRRRGRGRGRGRGDENAAPDGRRPAPGSGEPDAADSDSGEPAVVPAARAAEPSRRPEGPRRDAYRREPPGRGESNRGAPPPPPRERPRRDEPPRDDPWRAAPTVEEPRRPEAPPRPARSAKPVVEFVEEPEGEFGAGLSDK